MPLLFWPVPPDGRTPFHELEYCMSIERTLSIIKPDAVAKNVVGEIISRFEKNGLRVVAAKMVRLTDATAGGFYADWTLHEFGTEISNDAARIFSEIDGKLPLSGAIVHPVDSDLIGE